MKVVIVGAGPAGLVTCKTLLEAASTELPFDPIVLEQDDDVGGAFRTRWYEDANLVSSKQLTAFSDFRFSSSDLDHLPLEQYVDYLRAYSKNFRIEERTQFNSKVVNIRRAPEGGHFISYVRKRTDGSGQWEDSPTVIHATYVAICTGLLTMPAVPDIPGIENILNNTTLESEDAGIKPAIFHSEDYKSRSQLAGRKLLILGSGETAMDLAYGAAQVGAKEVVLCSRSGFLSFPKYLNDFEILGFQFKSNNPIPTDCLSTNFTDTAYVHPWIAASRSRWFISDFVLKWASWFLTGTQAGVNQWVGELEPKRRSRAYAFPNKSPKAMPYINRPYRNPPKTLDYFSRYIDPPEDMPPNIDFGVELAPFPSHVLPSGRVVFPVSKRKDAIRIARKDVRPDTVIYATGFKQEFNFFDPESKYASLGETDIRDITKTGDESVGFIGFLRPGYGAIPPVVEMQAFFWISLLKGQVEKPLPPPHYHLLLEKSARIKNGIDYSTYVGTLAKDIGAAPGLWELWREYGSRVLICYCFGAAFTPFFRLVGPFRSEHAPEIIKTELWETITRGGILGNLLMSIPVLLYGTLNATAYLAERLGRTIGAL